MEPAWTVEKISTSPKCRNNFASGYARTAGPSATEPAHADGVRNIKRNAKCLSTVPVRIAGRSSTSLKCQNIFVSGCAKIAELSENMRVGGDGMQSIENKNRREPESATENRELRILNSTTRYTGTSPFAGRKRKKPKTRKRFWKRDGNT